MNSGLKAEIERLLAVAANMEAENRTMAEHGRGSALTDHVVALTRLIAAVAAAQRVGF